MLEHKLIQRNDKSTLQQVKKQANTHTKEVVMALSVDKTWTVSPLCVKSEGKSDETLKRHRTGGEQIKKKTQLPFILGFVGIPHMQWLLNALHFIKEAVHLGWLDALDIELEQHSPHLTLHVLNLNHLCQSNKAPTYPQACAFCVQISS